MTMRLLLVLFVLAHHSLLLAHGALAADAHDCHVQLMRATVKVAHERSTATGFLVRQSRPAEGDRILLVTATHVLTATTGPAAALEFRFPLADGSFERRRQPLPVRDGDRPLWTAHPREDVAILPVTLPAEVTGAALPFDCLASEESVIQQRIHPGEALFLLGYPHRTEANSLGFPILRQGTIASYPLVPIAAHPTFLFSGNTFEGDSGGPLYRVGHTSDGTARILLLGLMHGQRFLDEDMTMVYGSTKLRHRLGLGIVVQADFIRQTIALVP